MFQKFTGVKMLDMWLYAFFTATQLKVSSFITTKKEEVKWTVLLNLVIDIFVVLLFAAIVVLIQYLCDKVSIL